MRGARVTRPITALGLFVSVSNVAEATFAPTKYRRRLPKRQTVCFLWLLMGQFAGRPGHRAPRSECRPSLSGTDAG